MPNDAVAKILIENPHHYATETVMNKAHLLMDCYAANLAGISKGDKDAAQRAQRANDQLRAQIRHALTQAYLEGCSETAAAFRK